MDSLETITTRTLKVGVGIARMAFTAKRDMSGNIQSTLRFHRKEYITLIIES